MPDLLTLTIAGHDFTLVPGRRYGASRPMMADREQTNFPVTIQDITEPGLDASIVATVDGLTYDHANELLAAFNGSNSFEGRVWGPEQTAAETTKLSATDQALIDQALARPKLGDLGHRTDREPEPDRVEEPDFTAEDFEAADRAWANIAAREKAIATGEIDPEEEDDEDFYKFGDFGSGEPDPDLDRFYHGED